MSDLSTTTWGNTYSTPFSLLKWQTSGESSSTILVKLTIPAQGSQEGEKEGRVTQKRQPSPRRPELSTHMLPPIASTNRLQM